MNEIDVIQMYSTDFDAKSERVEIELNRVLKLNSKVLSTYIENNSMLISNLQIYAKTLQNKKNLREKIHKTLTQNYSKIILKGKCKENKLFLK